MGKTAFIFPGQGAQYGGMGKDFYEKIPACREVMDLASRTAGMDIPALCFEENPDLHVTKYTQIAMLAVEAAILRAVRLRGWESQVNGGLSLGEYGALIASEVLSEEDAFRAVCHRGRLMQEAVPEGGAMAAVLGCGAELIEKVCGETEGIVSIANYNCPGQIVITGEEDAVARELCSRGITVNAVAPGFVDTEMTRVLSEEVREGALKQIPLGRFGKPSDVANVVAFLASEKADYITGQVIRVDGGMNM